MFTLKDFMLAEAEGKDPQEEMAQKQDKVVSLVSDIRKIMTSLSMVEPEDAAKDPRSFSFVDLIEALNTTEDVIRERLANESTKVAVGKTGKFRDSVTDHKEWKNEDKNEYVRLFKSIGDQVKETIRTMFTVPQGEGQTGVLPRFVHSFNQLVVDKLMDALQEMGPEAGKAAISGIIDSAKNAVINQERRSGKETSADNMKILTKYRQARKRTIGKKPPGARTKRDRLKLIKDVASAIQR